MEWIDSIPEEYAILASERRVIHSVTRHVYQSLPEDTISMIARGLEGLYSFLRLRWAIPREDQTMWTDLTQNDNLALRAMVNMLLPHIEDDHLDTQKHSVRSLTDIYQAKTARGYRYCNMQFNRCYRTEDGILERPFLPEYFYQSIELFLQSLNVSVNSLYVNWVDLIPADLFNVWESDLYQKTRDKVLHMPEDYPSRGGVDLLPGLSYETIYNSITHYLYDEIYQYKWLIFDYPTGTGTQTFYSYLQTELPSPGLWEGMSWSQVSDAERRTFQNAWRQLQLVRSPQSTAVLLALYYTMINRYSRAELLLREGMLQLHSDLRHILDDVDEVDLRDPRWTRDPGSGLAPLPAEELWAFLREQLTYYRKSWYAHAEEYSSTLQKWEPVQLADGYLHQITPKNVYNLAKSLTHTTRGRGTEATFTALPRFWCSLDREERTVFLRRLGDLDGSSWFNVSGYLRRLYPDLPRDQLQNANRNLYLGLQPVLIKAVFHAMILHGTLTVYRPAPLITDERISPNKDAQKSALAKTFDPSTLDNYDAAFYWLTGERYTLMPEMELSSGRTTDWWGYLSEDQIWTFTYAMNWTSQLSFFHKFLHNRVIMVTGSTGVGKSTQVPKLLLYGLVAFCYRWEGRTVCTQPRIQPTEQNAANVSRELGLPITASDDRYGTLPTEHYQVQYQHSGGSHKSDVGPYLRFMTDGSLLADLATYPFLTSNGKGTGTVEGQSVDWGLTPGARNVYDIVIVDEAHEHNANMDMILTMVRSTVGVNNSLRLVIVSATMDDDEPRYRRYYRDINDNLLWPLSRQLPELELDRANLDRRIHISPPGATTQFPITDVYLSEAEAEQMGANYLAKGISVTAKVANTTTSGDLLFFLAGQSEIIKAVTELNKQIPSDVIALPYYRELDTEQRAIVMEVHKRLPLYTKAKSGTGTVPAGTYRRAIIVSTNIAEASITIKNLRYVIDAGVAKSRIYDPMSGAYQMRTERISQSSSTQRRGRVGRVAAGTVYYLYTKTALADSPTKFKICQDNPAGLVSTLLQQQPSDVPLYPVDADPTRVASWVSPDPPSTLQAIYRAYYSYNPAIVGTGSAEQYPNYLGLWSANPIMGDGPPQFWETTCHDDYGWKERGLPIRYHTGLSYQNLIDRDGQYYLVHPDEDVIRREPLTGRILEMQPELAISEAYGQLLSTRGTPVKIEMVTQTMRDLTLVDTSYQTQFYQLPRHPVYYPPGEVTYTSQRLDDINGVTARLGWRIADYQDAFWLASLVGLPGEIWIDGLAVHTMISSGDLSMWFTGYKKAAVQRQKRKFRDRKGDLHWAWQLWREFSSVLAKSTSWREATTPVDSSSQYDLLLQGYRAGSVLDRGDYLTLSSMDRAGVLDANAAYRMYLDTLPPNTLDQIPSELNGLIRHYDLPPSITLSFLNNVIRTVHRTRLSLLRSPDLPAATRLVSATTSARSSSWDALLHNYLRSHPERVLTQRKGQLSTVPPNLSFTLAPWNPYVPLDRTYTNLTNHVAYYSFDPDLHVLWITPVSIEDAIRAAPHWWKGRGYHVPSVYLSLDKN